MHSNRSPRRPARTTDAKRTQAARQSTRARSQARALKYGNMGR